MKTKQNAKRLERLFSFDEVKGLLCDLCRQGMQTTYVLTLGEPALYHYANGQELKCPAATWRMRATTLMAYENAQLEAKKKAKKGEADEVH